MSHKPEGERHRSFRCLPASISTSLPSLTSFDGVPFEKEQLAHADRQRVIYVQHVQSSAPDRRQTHKHRAFVSKVISPPVRAWIKQSNQRAGSGRIQTGDVWAFMDVAMKAREREIGENGRAAVLRRDHMIDLEWRLISARRHMAVFAAMIRSGINLRFQFFSHGGARW